MPIRFGKCCLHTPHAELHLEAFTHRAVGENVELFEPGDYHACSICKGNATVDLSLVARRWKFY